MVDSTGYTRVHKLKLSDFVYHKIFKKIAEGSHEVGERLPSENDLATKYGASRTVVREALDRLRDDGMVESRKGSGSYITGSVAQTSLGMNKEPLTIAAIQCCYEFRISLESECAYWAAQRANVEVIKELEAINNRIIDTAAQDSYDIEADFSFHLEVAHGANNYLFGQTMQFIKDHAYISMNIGGACLTGGQYSFDNVINEHQEIITAIKDHDADRARQAMRNHITTARDRVFKSHLLDLKL